MFIKSLFDHNYWAKDKILDGVEAIDAQHLLKPSALSYGTISGLLTHMVNVEHLWRVRCRDGQSPSRPLFDEPITEFEVLRNAWQIEEELMLAYVSRLDEPTLSEKIRYRGQSGGRFSKRIVGDINAVYLSWNTASIQTGLKVDRAWSFGWQS